MACLPGGEHRREAGLEQPFEAVGEELTDLRDELITLIAATLSPRAAAGAAYRKNGTVAAEWAAKALILDPSPPVVAGGRAERTSNLT